MFWPLFREGAGYIATVALKEYKRVYENILAMEKKLDNARKYLVRIFSYPP